MERNEVKERHAGCRGTEFRKDGSAAANLLARSRATGFTHRSGRHFAPISPSSRVAAPAAYRGPVLSLPKGTAARGSGQSFDTRPLARSLLRMRERGWQRKAQRPAQQGQRARRRQAEMRCVHAVALVGEGQRPCGLAKPWQDERRPPTLAPGSQSGAGSPSQAKEGHKVAVFMPEGTTGYAPCAFES